ncbi:hypothetical protein JFT60_17045 [Pseudomonas sp. MF6772]|jgi:hypothetical protein|uniref:hypothetical protein n=1 Tax=Pseudomonas TaxID=286 RepID=UPI000B0AD4BE|nr:MULTISPECIES: hypothetical protein [Pseudomonas]SUD42914.1 Uncharacterised protein [Pseudomonas fluorescens]MBJ2241728.1 hypothetical protein [Pseudomonas sp. MF6768]MBJ2263916.1 hypothetical protein [Pseudomonas sp. MF6787]MBJ2269093.1 hypothetical protein [Pseudomonas sp. MF6772]MBJ2293510.1 hypothetical protein [Pseudomonas sp. MF5691]
MKVLHSLFTGLLIAASTAALADDGGERSRQLLAEFRQQQQQIHGTQVLTQQTPAPST